MDSNGDDVLLIYEGDLTEPDELNIIGNDNADENGSDIEIIAEVPGRAMEVEVKKDATEDVLTGSDTRRETPKNKKAARRRRLDEGDATTPMKRLRLQNPVPIHQPFSFAKWANSNGDLHLREVARVYDIGQALGGAFDAHKGFLFTGGRAIYCCTETGENKRTLVEDIDTPSAIAVIKSGERFCFLGNEGIYEYNWYEKRCVLVAPVNDARGLVYMDGGTLITAAREDGVWYLCVYDANTFNKLSSYTFRPKGLPCFLSSYKNTLFVTDLGTRSLTTYEMNKQFALVDQERIDLQGMSIPKGFRFPSGIAVDRRCEVIIADAHVDDGFLMWGSAKLDEWKIVKMSRPFPYTAAISISPGGYLLAATRHSNGIKIFRFVEEPDGMDNA